MSGASERSLLKIIERQNAEILGLKSQVKTLVDRLDGRNETERKVLEIVSETERVTGVSRAEILGKKRHRNIVKARWLAMQRARDIGLSYPEIGRVFDRDHTSVMHGVKSVLARQAELTRGPTGTFCHETRGVDSP